MFHLFKNLIFLKFFKEKKQKIQEKKRFFFDFYFPQYGVDPPQRGVDTPQYGDNNNIYNNKYNNNCNKEKIKNKKEM
jgi:hypothetical protein